MNHKEYLAIAKLLDQIEAIQIEWPDDEYHWLKKLVVSWAARQGIGPDVDFDMLVQAARFGIGVAVLSVRKQNKSPMLIISRPIEAA